MLNFIFSLVFMLASIALLVYSSYLASHNYLLTGEVFAIVATAILTLTALETSNNLKDWFK